jgi:putative transposase
MMAERGISIDHSTIHRWVVHFAPLLLKRFNRRKRAVTGKWHADETYIKGRGPWMYLYRAIDNVGDTVEFWFSEYRDLPAAKRFFAKALARHCRPDRIVIDGSQTNREAIVSCDATNRLQDCSRRRLRPIEICRNRYLNNRIEQDHRRINITFDRCSDSNLSWRVRTSRYRDNIARWSPHREPLPSNSPALQYRTE